MLGVKASSRQIASRYLGARAVRHTVGRSFNSTTHHLASSQSDGDSQDPDSLRFVSQFKSPIVQQLWIAREEAKANVAENGHSLPDHRVPSQSQTSVSYPFSTNEFLKESYRNPYGQARFGKILEDLDALAGNIGKQDDFWWSEILPADYSIVCFETPIDSSMNLLLSIFIGVQHLRMCRTLPLLSSQRVSTKFIYLGCLNSNPILYCQGKSHMLEPVPWRFGCNVATKMTKKMNIGWRHSLHL